MSNDNFIAEPVSGVYKAVLQENMIDTVTTTHKQYVKAYVEELWDKNKAYPYTYIPMWGMVLPLKKNDTILIKFEHGNSLYPVMYRNTDELDTQSYEKQSLPSSGSEITVPDASDTLTSYKFGDDSYIITTDSYMLVRYTNKQCVLFTSDSSFVIGDNIKLLSKGSSGKIQMEAPSVEITTTGKQKIGTSSSTLGALLGEFIDDITTLTTYGSPAAHQVTPTSVAQLKSLKSKIQAVFS